MTETVQRISTDIATLLALAERVEADTKSRAATDARIVVALNLRPHWLKDAEGELWFDERSLLVRFKDKVIKRRSPGNPPLTDYPAFTSSRDAALSLRLDWMSVEMTESATPASSPELRFTRCRIWDWRRGPKAMDPTNEWSAEGNRPLPLNICSAILRARAALSQVQP